MPKLTPGAKTTELAPMVAQMRQTPWGRFTAAARYFISGVTPDVWMSPNQPVQPVAQQAFGRNRDYPVGYNLYWTPRGGELSSFAQLRALADNCDLVRLAIEKRKDQLAALPWTVTYVDETRADEGDPRLVQLRKLFQRPDRILGWSAWLRQVAEEMLVIDAATILPRKLNNGSVYGFEVIDGATIKPLIDDDGRMPMPPSPAYQQALHGMPAVDYRADELIYLPRNARAHKFYGFSPVEQIMMTVNVALRRSISQLQYFTEGNIPAMMATLPPEWQPGQIKDFQSYWDTVIEGEQGFKRKVRFVPGGTKSENLTQAPLKDEFDEWLARIVCFAFSLPPTAFIKQNNRATAATAQETAEEEGLQPLKEWVKELMDVQIQDFLGFDDIQFQWVEQEVVDQAQQATVLTTYQKTGVYTINQIRAKLGEDPIEGDGGDVYLIITPTGAVPLEQAIKPPEPPQLGDNPAKPGAEPPPAGAPKDDDLVAKRAPPHSHKPDDSPLTPDTAKVKDAFAVALGEVRDAVQAQIKGVTKAAGGDGGQPQPPKKGDDWWLALANDADLSGLSLAWDDYSDTLLAVTPQGARIEVAHLVATDPSLQAQATGAGFDMLDHQDPNAVEWARQHVAEMLSRNADGGKLVESTRDMIREAITTALESHDTDDAIADMLRDAYAFSEQRAELIARTEVGNALGAGSFIGAQAVGMEEKRWLLSNDEGVCPRCQANADEGWISIGQDFASGDKYPLAHPHCRCDAAYRRKPQED